MHHIDIYALMHTGTLMCDMPFKSPCTALFFNHSLNKLVVACKDDIFIVDMSAQSLQPFSGTPKGAYYQPHALALPDDDAVLVAGCNSPFSVCGYDTASATRLWIHSTVFSVGAVCMLGTHVIVTVYGNPTLILDRKTGVQIATLSKADGGIFGLGVIEGLSSLFLNLTSSQISTPPCISPCCSASSTSKPSPCICHWRCGTVSRGTACSS